MRADKVYTLYCGISVVDRDAGRQVSPDALLDPQARYDVALDFSLHDPSCKTGRDECVMHVEWIDLNDEDASLIVAHLSGAVQAAGGSCVPNLDRAACSKAESAVLQSLCAIQALFQPQVPQAPPAADGSESLSDEGAAGAPSQTQE